MRTSRSRLDDACGMDAHAVAVQVFIGGEFETQSVYNMTRLVDAGLPGRHAGSRVTAVGREMAGTPALPATGHADLRRAGAQIVKTYYCEPKTSTP